MFLSFMVQLHKTFVSIKGTFRVYGRNNISVRELLVTKKLTKSYI